MTFLTLTASDEGKGKDQRKYSATDPVGELTPLTVFNFKGGRPGSFLPLTMFCCRCFAIDY